MASDPMARKTHSLHDLFERPQGDLLYCLRCTHQRRYMARLDQFPNVHTAADDCQRCTNYEDLSVGYPARWDHARTVHHDAIPGTAEHAQFMAQRPQFEDFLTSAQAWQQHAFERDPDQMEREEAAFQRLRRMEDERTFWVEEVVESPNHLVDQHMISTVHARLRQELMNLIGRSYGRFRDDEWTIRSSIYTIEGAALGTRRVNITAERIT